MLSIQEKQPKKAKEDADKAQGKFKQDVLKGRIASQKKAQQTDKAKDSSKENAPEIRDPRVVISSKSINYDDYTSFELRFF